MSTATTSTQSQNKVLIDKLLHACVKQGASDMHITVGQPPVFRLHGHMQPLGDQSRSTPTTRSA